MEMGEDSLGPLLGAEFQGLLRLAASSADARLLDATMQQSESWPQYEKISSHQGSELDSVIAKPWGHEYRIYRDPFFDIWLLNIESGHSTSEHCHPRKSTALICLSGEGRLEVLAGSYMLSANDIVVIGKGVFHSTKNVGKQPLEIIEVEVPRNKFDLVRAGDSYGRKASPYSDPPINEIAVAAMEDTPLLRNAKYRPFCTTGRTRFDVVRGDELPCGAHPRDEAFSVVLSLDTSCALNDSITLFASTVEWPRAVDPAGVYFTIFNTPAQADCSRRRRGRVDSRAAGVSNPPGNATHARPAA